MSFSSYYGADPSRLGQENLAGVDDALFLKVFAGEVLTTFEANNAMMPLHRVRTISSGKTAQFPVTGVAAAKYHTPGESLLVEGVGGTDDTAAGDDVVADTNKYLSKIAHAERTIAIDGVLTASSFLADIDEAKNHYEVRSIYSTEIGRQLAYTADKNLIRTVIAGARATTGRFGGTNAGGDDQFGGAKIVMAGTATSASNEILGIDNVQASADLTSAALVGAFLKAAELMDSKNVPSEGRYAVLPPNMYYLLLQGDRDAINRDFQEGNGSLAGGEVVSVSGIRIVKSNHVPTTNESSGSTIHNDALVNNDVFGGGGVGYGQANFSQTRGIIFQSEGVGTVKLLDLAMQSEYILERLGTLMVAKYAMGHGVLREECCYELIEK